MTDTYLISTVSSPVSLRDLGLINPIPHPTVDLNLLSLGITKEEIDRSTNLRAALDGGLLTATYNGLDVVPGQDLKQDRLISGENLKTINGQTLLGSGDMVINLLMADPGANGIVIRTALNTTTSRTLEGTSGRISVTNGSGVSGNPAIDLATVGTAGTYVSVTTDAYGRVTSGNTTQAWSTISSTPTTLGGYGITDAAPSSHVGAGGGAHANATISVAGFMSATDKSKLDGIAPGATANASDATLLARANHTGTQLASTISDFAEAVDDRVGSLLVAGTNVTLDYNDGANTLTINASGAAGIADPGANGIVIRTALNTTTSRTLEGTAGRISVTNGTGVSGNPVIDLATAGTAGTYVSVTTDAYGRVTSGNTSQAWSTISSTPTTLGGYGITDAAPSSHVGAGGGEHATATISAAGFMSATDKSKLDGIAAGATANASDATLLARANHTGTQSASTISDFSEAVDDRVAALLVAGTNVTLDYNDGANTLTINAAGGGGMTDPGANGIVIRTALNTTTSRTLEGTAGRISVTNGTGVSGNPVIDLATAGTAGTYVSVTTDAYGRVTSGNTSQAWSTISSTPTTLGGYGITDAAPSSHVGVGGTEHPNATTVVSGFMSSSDKTKLDGIASGATANSSDATLLSRANHTGTQDWSTITGTPTTLGGYSISDATPSSHIGSGHTAHALADTDFAGFMSAADKSKLNGIATGATANASDATLLARANHTGTQLASTISDFSEAVDDRVGALLVAGSNITLDYTLPNTIIINASSGGGGSPGGSNTQIQYNDSGAFAGSADFTWDNATKTLALNGTNTGLVLRGIDNEPAAPSSGNLRLYSKSIAGKLFPKFVGPSGLDSPLQPSLFGNRIGMILPSTTTSLSNFGLASTNLATLSTPALSTTNFKSGIKRTVFTTSTTAGNVSGTRSTAADYWRGNAEGRGGFLLAIRFSMETTGADNRALFGLHSGNLSPTNVDPLSSTALGKIAVACNTNTGNWFIVHNAVGAAVTTIDTGIAINTTAMYEIIFFCAPNGGTVGYRFVNLETGSAFSGTIETNLPANTVFMSIQAWITNNATAAARAMSVSRIYIETDL